MSGLESCPGCHPERSEESHLTQLMSQFYQSCHPERSEGSLRPSSQTFSLRSELALERSEGVTGILSTCLW